MQNAAYRVGELVADELEQEAKARKRQQLEADEVVFTELCPIVVLGKVLTAGGDMTAEFICRCNVAAVEAVRLHASGNHRAVVVVVSGHAPPAQRDQQVRAEDTEGGKGAFKVRELIRSMGGDNWPIFTTEEPPQNDFQISFPCIVIEPEASDTELNAAKTAAYLRQVRHLVAKRRAIRSELMQVDLRVSTAGYHFERMSIRAALLPEKSEIMTWKHQLPGATISRLEVPYPPLTSTDPSTNWQARVYVTGHIFFDALMAYLFGIANGQVQRLSPTAVARCEEGVQKLGLLYHELNLEDIEQHRYKKPVPTVHANLAAQIAPLKALLRCIVRETSPILDGADDVLSIKPETWLKWAKSLAGYISEPIRWEADPDRR